MKKILKSGMMKKRDGRCAVCFSFFLLLAVLASAQDMYVFESLPVVLPEVKANPQESFLGEDICLKLAQFRAIYTKTAFTGSGNYIGSTEILKPDIYYSTLRLCDYFSRCLKKGATEGQTMENRFKAILDKSIRIAACDTELLEKELKSTNNPKDIIRVFDRIVIK